MTPRFARILRPAVAAAVALSCATPARAAVLTFEELDPGQPAVAPFQEYAGLGWAGAYYVAHPPEPVPPVPSPWFGTRGAVALYTQGGGQVVITRPQRFTFGSALVTAAREWSDMVMVEGERDGARVPGYVQVIFPGYLPERFAFGFVDVDTVRITPLGSEVTFDDVEVAGYDPFPADTVAPTIDLQEVPALTGGAAALLRGRAYDQDGSSAGLAGSAVSAGVVTPLAIDAATGNFEAWAPLAEGPNDVAIEVRDPAGNVGRRVVSVTRDSIAPAVEFLTPTPGMVVGTIEYPVSVRVDDASAVTLVLDGWLEVPVVNGVATATLAVPYRSGLFVVTAQATDAAGNATWASVEPVAALPDLALSVDVASGTAFGPLSGDLLPLAVTVAGPYPASVTLSSGASFDVPAGGGSIQASVPLVPGPNALWVRAADLAAQEVVLPVLVTYDPSPPSAAFLAPLDGAVVRGAVEVALEAVDDFTGVASVALSVDGGPAVPAAGGPVYAASLDLAGLADGAHVVSAVVTDRVGNAVRPSVGVLLDATPPEVSLVSPLPGAAITGVLTVAARASDATSGVQAIRLLVNGQPVGECAAATACEATFDSATLPDGPFAVLAVATDLAGNEALAQATAIADNSAPSKFLLAPAPGQVVAGSFEVVVDVQDPSFAWAECTAGGASLGRSDAPAFRRTVDVTGVLDGPLEVACTAVDVGGNAATERVTVTVRNWTLALHPRVLVASAGPASGAVVTLRVEGPNVALLAPASARALALAVPGGATTPLVPHPAGEAAAERDGVQSLKLKFERGALLSAVRGGIAAGVIAAGRPVQVRLLDGDRVLGATTVEVR